MRHPRRVLVVTGAALVAVAATIGALVGTGTLGGGDPAPLAGASPRVTAPVPRGPVPSPLRLPAAVSLTPGTGGARPGAVTAVVAKALRDPALGLRVAGLVVDAAGQPLYASDPTRAVVPASTTKLLTATAALTVLGPDATLQTRVLTGGSPQQVVLVGGGDPTLASVRSPDYPQPALLTTLAARTADALRRARVRGAVRVGYTAGLYAGPTLGPGWKTSYVTEGDVAPVSALEVDEGRVSPGERPRVTDPAGAAAERFAAALARRGVRVAGVPTPTGVPAGGHPVASVSSPPISALVERMLTDSDNDLAEALGRQVALALSRPPTFAGAAAAVLEAVSRAGVAPLAGVRLVDTSGLARADRVTAATLVSLLRAAIDPARPELRAIDTGLPVAGLTGTLADRYTGSDRRAAGAVRAKTGTLSHVSAIAGTTVDRSGQLLIFAFVANAVRSLDPTAAEHALDTVATALTSCGCG